MNFDELIDRRGTHSAKWDNLQQYYDLSPDDGLAMWVADMDFRPPAAVQRRLEEVMAGGIYGYFGNPSPYIDAICWWMQNRHGWSVDPAAIFTTHGLVNGTGMCVDAYTAPGDGIVMFTPIYHAFFRVIEAAGRRVVECPMALNDGRYTLDFDAYDAMMDGSEKMIVFCSPHNPGGRVWTQAELTRLADFARRHDLLIVSDEIHHDLVFPDQKHIPLAVAAPEIADRLIMMSATTKTFNMAGCHTGNVIIPDAELRKPFAARMAALGISPNSFGLHMVEAAYSEDGAQWVDALMAYLDGNRRILDEGLNAIPGLKSMPLEGTYLAWVDFSGTGMSPEEVKSRILKDARIAVNYGQTFGKGGEGFQRFNFATPRARIEQAVERMQKAFGDLQ
ncbi:MalY/PatB family protein [Pseudooceanicola aestuarii]|uniref:MalY/PatB family protein n=1 Tax=Pseudooceanicola aestuarii TaxID=2697319 RepID=UPI0013D038A0|nr:MalY/PatB family protein [Pseudooceanicola aestuarii]